LHDFAPAHQVKRVSIVFGGELFLVWQTGNMKCKKPDLTHALYMHLHLQYLWSLFLRQHFKSVSVSSSCGTYIHSGTEHAQISN
jgi:hypothetical protein